MEKGYYYKKMPDAGFCIDIILRKDLKSGSCLNAHWHEHPQLYYFVSGSALLECGKNSFMAGKGDIVVINSSEVHFMESLADDLSFYVIRFDFSFLFSYQTDSCQTKYLLPLSQNLILFKNLITDDEELRQCVVEMIEEYTSRRTGYELAVKAAVYKTIALLFRRYMEKVLTEKESTQRAAGLQKLGPAVAYLEAYYIEDISLDILAGKAHISKYHFCRLFKKIIGKTPVEYITELRLRKATELLASCKLTVAEVALQSGFGGINYFSRSFKKYYHQTPSEYRKNKKDY